MERRLNLGVRREALDSLFDYWDRGLESRWPYNFVRVAQLDRARVSEARGRAFESRSGRHFRARFVLLQRYFGAHGRADAGRRFDGQASANHFDAFFHTNQPQALGVLGQEGLPDVK